MITVNDKSHSLLGIIKPGISTRFYFQLVFEHLLNFFPQELDPLELIAAFIIFTNLSVEVSY